MIERRSLQQAEQKPDGLTITLPFNSRSQDLGGFVEVISPTAFTRTLADQATEVLALWSHRVDMPLARRSTGSLTLSADGVQLTAHIKPDQTTWSADAAASIAAGTTRGGSFGFVTKSDSWERRSGQWFRVLNDVDLLEISPVALPAYPQSSAA